MMIFLRVILIVVLTLMAAAFFVIGVDPRGMPGLSQAALTFLGVASKNEALTFIGAIMGGILLALNALAADRRARAMENAAEAQAAGMTQQAKANEHTEQRTATRTLAQRH